MWTGTPWNTNQTDPIIYFILFTCSHRLIRSWYNLFHKLGSWPILQVDQAFLQNIVPTMVWALPQTNNRKKNKKLHEKQTCIELQANGFNVTCVLEWLRLNTCQRRNKIERRFCCKTIDLEWISTINLITQRLILLRIVSDLRSHSLSYHTFETNHKTKKTVNATIPHKPTKKKRISTHLPF